jgi:hypothetical protein
MFDGSALLRSSHWKALRGAFVLNFSRTLHNIASIEGCNSYFITFYPEPQIKNPTNVNPPYRVLFWERQPQYYLNESFVSSLFDPKTISHIHIHRDYDPKSYTQTHKKINSKCKITYSSWFKNKSEYFNILKKSDIYVAPRLAEGIGFGFLEAMALGKCVIANDAPTHNEYIHNWKNGILINDGVSNIEIGSDQYNFISSNALLTVRNGHDNWLHEVELSLNLIDSYFESAVKPSCVSDVTFHGLINTFSYGIEFYDEYLRTHMARLAENRNHVAEIDDFKKQPQILKMPLLMTPFIMNFSSQEKERFTGEGWYEPEKDLCWMNGRSSDINFCLNKEDLIRMKGKTLLLNTKIRTHTQLKSNVMINVIFNGTSLNFNHVSTNWKESVFKFNGNILKDINKINFHTNQSGPCKNDQRNLSIAIQAIKISEA